MAHESFSKGLASRLGQDQAEGSPLLFCTPMSDDDRSSGSSQMSAVEFTALPRKAVEVIGAPFIRGEIALADGTILNVMLVIPGVSRVEGLKDPLGNPVDELQSAVVMGVKHVEKGH